MRTKERYDGIIGWFSENMPVAESELNYENTFQLLVAVILSAQCTDKRVNLTTPALFEAFPTPQALAAATVEQVYSYIRSISYPNNKAKNLVAMARMLCAEFGGEVPSDIDSMMRLPGVGRKTANVVGAVLSMALIFVMDMFDVIIHDKKKIEDTFDVPILGVIPRFLAEEGKSKK